MPSFDRIAKILSLTQALGADDYRNAHAAAMRVSALGNAMQLPFDMQKQQQELQYFPLRQEAELQSAEQETMAQKLQNLLSINQGVRDGMRGQFNAQGIPMEGLPPELSNEQLMQAFQAVMQRQEIDPQLLQQLKFNPGAGQILAALQEQLK